MKYFLLSCIVLIVSCMVGCSSENEAASVTIPNGISLKILDHEKVIPASSALISQHDSLFNSYGSISWPLYKSVSSDEYQIFIGMPVGTTRQELIEAITSRGVTDSFQTDSTSFVKYSRDSLFIVTAIANYRETTWSMSAVSNDSSAVAFLFDQKNFAKRIKLDE